MQIPDGPFFFDRLILDFQAQFSSLIKVAEHGLLTFQNIFFVFLLALSMAFQMGIDRVGCNLLQKLTKSTVRFNVLNFGVSTELFLVFHHFY
jgi:hypothetical protein